MTSRRPASENEPVEPAPRPGTKGRPTRTQKEALAARRRPLVVADRKEAKRRDRAKAQQQRMAAQQALMSGDEKNMPLQHRGPERRFVRDFVDARHNVAEYFLPVALVFVVITLVLPFFNQNLYFALSSAMLIVLWGGMALCVVDALLMRRSLRRRLTERFGDVTKGLVGYAIMRQIQIRRWRLPRPQVKRGDEVN